MGFRLRVWGVGFRISVKIQVLGLEVKGHNSGLQ